MAAPAAKPNRAAGEVSSALPPWCRGGRQMHWRHRPFGSTAVPVPKLKAGSRQHDTQQGEQEGVQTEGAQEAVPSDAANANADADRALAAADCFRQCGIDNVRLLCGCVESQVAHQRGLPPILNVLMRSAGSDAIDWDGVAQRMSKMAPLGKWEPRWCARRLAMGHAFLQRVGTCRVVPC